MLRFSPLSDDEMETVLRAELPDADVHEIAALIAAGEGSPGRALGLSGLDIAGMEASFDDIARDGDVNNELRLALSKALSTRSEEHTSELQSLMRTSYDVFCLKKKKKYTHSPI